MKLGYKQYKFWMKPEVFNWLWMEKHRINDGILAQKISESKGKIKILTEAEEIVIGDIIGNLIAAVMQNQTLPASEDKEVKVE